MKRILTILTLLALTGAVKAQTNDPGLDLLQTIQDFKSGTITNVLVLGGSNYDTATHKWGGEGLLGYNLPKATTMPFQPYFVPLAGLTYLGNSWQGFSGTVSLNSQIHPLSEFDGGATNGFLHNFALTINGLGGVGEDLSGSQFGSFKVPGKAPANGQGTAAITGEGVSCHLFTTKSVRVGIWFERFDWTTISGDILAGGVEARFFPKGW
jgi:hypothetical protein